MALHRSVVGLDIGAQAIKAVQVRISGRVARAERSVAIRRAVLEAEGVDLADKAALARAIRRRLQEARIHPRGVVLGIDGKDSIIRYTHSPPMPPRRLEMVMKYEIDSMAERMGEPLASDFSILPVMREVDDDQNILMGLAKEGPQAELLDALEAAGITVWGAVPAPLGLYGAWDLFGSKADPDAPEDDLLLAADLGAASLNMVLVLNNRLAFARSATFGGDSFTEALAQALRMSPEEAEQVKIRRGGLKEGLPGVVLDTVGPLRGVAGQLLSLVQSTLRFCGTQAGIKLPPITRLWLTGGGMRLKGLPEYLSTALGNKPFELFDPVAGAAGEAGTPSKGAEGPEPSLGLAAGLSAVGLRAEKERQGAVVLNILPKKYRARRHFRERTLFLHAAAAFLVALLSAQLVHGVLRNANASRTLSELQRQRNELEARKQQMSESIEQSGRTRERINRLLREAEPTAFQAFVLDFLGRHLRPEVQIQRIDLQTRPTDDDRANIYSLVIEGRVNNENRLGLDWILELQTALQQEERIRSAEVRDSQPQGAWYSFRIAVEPNTLTL
jgi:type IV pilus assembly protein PilM